MILKQKHEKLKKYLKKILNLNVGLYKIEKSELKKLPLYIVELYEIVISKLYKRDILFLFFKSENNNITPLQYYKHMKLIEDKFNMPVVIVFESLESYNRKRLIEKQVGFIVIDKIIFIPQLLIYLKDFRDAIDLKKTSLRPADQFLLLFHLQKENLSNKNFKQIAEITNYSPMTITRAFYRLKELNLCEIKGTKSKTIIFEKDKKLLFGKAKKHFINPIKKRLYIEELPKNINLIKSGINALSFYSDLSDEDINYYAISYIDFNLLIKDKKINVVDKYESNNVLEIWKYPPVLLSNNEYVDVLSLYIIYKDDSDERVQMELENMVKNIW